MRWSCAGPKFLLLRLRQALRRSSVAACCYIKYRKSQQRDAHTRVSSARATPPALAPAPAERASLAPTPSALPGTQALRPLAVAAMAPFRTAPAHASVSSSMPVAAVALKAALALALVLVLARAR